MPLAYTKGSCDHCGSSDANTKYEDGHSFCYSCKKYINGDKDMEVQKVVPMTNHANSTLKTEGIIDAITERRIAKDTARLYNTQVKKTGYYEYPSHLPVLR
jgi:twinkle protein